MLSLKLALSQSVFPTRAKGEHKESVRVEQLGPEICTDMLFCMPSLDVIQHPTCVALEKELPLRSSNQVYTFESKLKCSMHSQLPLKMLLLQDCKHWFVCTMGNLQNDLICCVIRVPARWLRKHLIYSITDSATHFSCSKVPQSPCILSDTTMERFWG